MKEDLEMSRMQLEEMKQQMEGLVTELTKSREECKMMYVCIGGLHRMEGGGGEMKRWRDTLVGGAVTL